MPSYRVCFINEIPRNDRLFRCCQRSIIIRWAASAEQAVEAAKEQFAKLEGIRDWRIHRSDRSGAYRDRRGTRDPTEFYGILRVQKISLAGRSPMIQTQKKGRYRPPAALTMR